MFISHDLGVVQYLSDRVLVMYLGEIVEIGPTDQVCVAPKHPYTQALLASQLSMNPAERIEERHSPAIRRACSTRRAAAASAPSARSRRMCAPSARQRSVNRGRAIASRRLPHDRPGVRSHACRSAGARRR